MKQRKYSVAEIMRMRESVERMFPSGVGYRQAERTAEVEARLQTYMVNGTSPEELGHAAAEWDAEESAALYGGVKWTPVTW